MGRKNQEYEGGNGELYNSFKANGCSLDAELALARTMLFEARQAGAVGACISLNDCIGRLVKETRKQQALDSVLVHVSRVNEYLQLFAQVFHEAIQESNVIGWEKIQMIVVQKLNEFRSTNRPENNPKERKEILKLLECRSEIKPQ